MTNEEAIYKIKVDLTDTCLAECRCKEGEYSSCDYCGDREAVRMAVKALEKQIPMKHLEDEEGYCFCPACKKRLTPFVVGFCEDCGQAIDWSEND